MFEEPPELNHCAPLTDERIRAHSIGELRPHSGRILVVPYDPRWPELFTGEAARIQAVLGPRALRIEHTGSTSVPDLCAKPIIDMLLVVTDSAAEGQYIPLLERAGYTLRIREPNWFEHRMFKGPDTDINLPVLSSACPEIECILLFREWLRSNPADREFYATVKLTLAQQEWRFVQNYAAAKTAAIDEIIQRARRDSRK